MFLIYDYVYLNCLLRLDKSFLFQIFIEKGWTIFGFIRLAKKKLVIMTYTIIEKKW